MQEDEIVQREAMRAESYRLLAACFYQPEKDVLMTDAFFSTLIRNLEKICPAALPFARDMEESAAKYTEEELTVEYAKLFVGPFELAAPPYGSVYLDQGRAVMGPSTAKVHQFYLSCGLKLDEDFRELPDHIAVELEFMAYLIHQHLAALATGREEEAEQYRDRQRMFFNLFLRTWVGSFCAALEKGSENGFYAGLAACLSTVTRFDGEQLAVQEIADCG